MMCDCILTEFYSSMNCAYGFLGNKRKATEARNRLSCTPCGSSFKLVTRRQTTVEHRIYDHEKCVKHLFCAPTICTFIKQDASDVHAKCGGSLRTSSCKNDSFWGVFQQEKWKDRALLQFYMAYLRRLLGLQL